MERKERRMEKCILGSSNKKMHSICTSDEKMLLERGIVIMLLNYIIICYLCANIIQDIICVFYGQLQPLDFSQLNTL
jgi:hypothetical protein